MHRLICVLALLIAPPAFAEDAPHGLSLMDRGAQMLMEGLLQEIEPALDDLQGMALEIGPALQDFAQQMGPALRDLLAEVEDWSAYHPPERLENGDIIIRRKTEPPQAPPQDIDI